MCWWLAGFRVWGVQGKLADLSGQQGRQAALLVAFSDGVKTTACRCALQKRALIESWICSLICRAASSITHRQGGL